MSRLKGKTALITIDQEGIAKYVASEFAKEGATIVIAGIKPAELQEIADAVQANGSECIIQEMNPEDPESCKNGFISIREKIGTLEILCNLAGTFPLSGKVHEINENDFDNAVQSNINTVLYVTRYALPLLRESGNGVIINLSHTASEVGVAGTGLIAATKGALINFTRCMALKESEHKVRANCICVGHNFVPVVPGQIAQQGELRTGFDKLTPTFIYLASDESNQVTGQMLNVDNGMTAWIEEYNTTPRSVRKSVSNDEQLLPGQVVLMTGGAGGVARCSSRLFAPEGAKIVLSDLNEEALSKAAQELRSEGIDVYTITGDVLNADDCRSIVKETLDKFGRLDILMNLVGFFGRGHETADEVDLADWDMMMDVNLKSVFMMSKYAIPEIVNSGGGSVINTATLAAVTGRDGGGYGASKSGVLSLTSAMAADYFNDHIRVNCVSPGAINTGMFHRGATGEELDKMLSDTANTNMGLAQPEEIAAGFLFFASEKLSSRVTGQILRSDNGYSTIRR